MSETPHFLTTEEITGEGLVIDEDLGVVVDPYRDPAPTRVSPTLPTFFPETGKAAGESPPLDGGKHVIAPELVHGRSAGGGRLSAMTSRQPSRVLVEGWRRQAEDLSASRPPAAVTRGFCSAVVRSTAVRDTTSRAPGRGVGGVPAVERPPAS